ncbi:glycosyltransferase [candidate division KSB1 bacterium]|nr:glycosyltransferase [candidate division KSB1 bacterium]
MHTHKILQLVSSGGFYGAENVILELAKAMRASEFDSLIGVFNNRYQPHLELAQEAHNLGLPVQLFPCAHPLDRHTLSHIRRVVAAEGIDLIHSHGYKANFYAWMAGKNRTSLITTCHLWTGTSLKNRAYEILDRTCLNRFDQIVAVSPALEAQVLAHGITRSKVQMILNGIDTVRFAKLSNTSPLKNSFSLPLEAPIITTIGRLTEQKGHLYLLQAVPSILRSRPDIHFLIVGDGHLKEKLQKSIQDLSISNSVHLVGAHKDIPGILALTDIFVLPSVDEGLPMVILEAMAAGKPIVATKVGGVAKAVEHNQTGLLIEPRDPHVLAIALLDLLQDINRCRALAQAAQRKAKADFSSAAMGSRYLEIYRTIVAKRSSQPKQTSAFSPKTRVLP